MKQLNLTRTQAAEILERVRLDLAKRRPPEEIERALAGYPDTTTEGMRAAWNDHSLPALPPLERCHGEAHSNPHIDNCGLCAPRWGWTGPGIKVR